MYVKAAVANRGTLGVKVSFVVYGEEMIFDVYLKNEKG